MYRVRRETSALTVHSVILGQRELEEDLEQLVNLVSVELL